ncbi:MAG: DUF4332 domain-containing protein [Gemmatimonadetes bacterium]|nr:DUF4332 domain-containing protein [Gemmatimonadota bacterium]
MTARQAPYVAGVASLLLGLGIGLGLRGVEPVATWLYIACWYPTIALMAAAVALREGRDPFTSNPVHALSLFAWSAVFWFFFELLNWRIANWYYVFVPADRASRWVGITLAFATVLPAIFLAARALEEWGLRTVRTKPLRVTPLGLRVTGVVGVVFLALPLAWPGRFFPLVWGATTLLAEPALYRRAPQWSLLADLERGQGGRILRLLVGGAAIGLLWEMYNSFARSRWIYTVPGLEELKLFEMPLLGFLGFPVFALECWSVFHLLASYGISTPETRLEGPVRYARKTVTAVLGVAFGVIVLFGMERFTISSTTPLLVEVPGLPASVAYKLAAEGASPFQLAEVSAAELARSAGGGVEEAARWARALRLVTLRGIGTENARRLASVGIRDIETLAVQDPDTLAARLRRGGASSAPRTRPTPAEVRVWVRAALKLTLPERRPPERSE